MNQSRFGKFIHIIPVPETSTHTLALDFDLNKTPPSPQNAAVNTNVVGAPADHRCNSCDRIDIPTVICPECSNSVHIDCLKATEIASKLMCAKCSMECHGRKKIRRTVSDGNCDGGGGSGDGDGVFDMNASPPCDFDGDDVAGDNKIDMLSCEDYLSLENLVADIVRPEQIKIWAQVRITGPTRMEFLGPKFAVLESKMQDTCGNPFIGFTSNSTNICANMQIARLNLDIATQNANLVYLQALKDYIFEKRGVLGDGWRVKFEYSESTCKNSPIYCAPDGSRFDSMQKVAHRLGLLSGCNSCKTNENGSTVGLLQNGSLSRVSIFGNAVEVDPMENCNRGAVSFLDGFPVQFEDFCIMSIGKIDPRFPFHNTCQIWPIGYKSIWHDKITGSIFVCNVLKNGDCGPLFRVNRYPCTKQSIPNASTLIYKPKYGSSDEISSCLIHESQDMTLNNFVNGDVIGEFSVEGRSPSSAWEIMLETLLFACRQTFQDLKVLNFCCNHSLEKSHHFHGSYGVDSLDKFGYVNSQVNSIPRLILTVDQLEDSCNVLRRWLLLDRFGLDVEFVQELIEQLPEADACLEYKYLNSRCQNSIAHTVGSGYFTVLRKYHSQPMVSDSLTENRERLGPPGNAIASKLPHGLIGNVLQAYEFCLRFHNILGQEASLSRQNLEYELLNPNSGSIKSIEGDKVEAFTSCSTIAPDTPKESEGDFSQSLLSNFHMSMLKVVVEDMLAKVVICDPCGALESKSRKGRKKNTEVNVYGKKSKFGIFPVNEVTWPELVRRYIMILLSMDDNFDDLDISSRKFDEMFRCLNGDGGPLCSYLTGMAAIEADAVVLAEASKKVFSSAKTKIVDFFIDKNDLNINNSAIETKRTDTKCPEWIKLLEPIRKQPTNVGAKIRNRVRRSLDKRPPEWATEMLLMSIRKDVYKGNAAGPTKKIVVEVLEKVRNENTLTKKKSKESRIIKTVSDVIIKRCRMVLRSVAAQDENKTCFGFMAESLLKANVSYDVGNPATVSRPLDFRTIDLRLDAGFYGDSHESFIEDVREVLQNLQMTYGKLPKYLDLIEKILKTLEELYEQEVLTLVNKAVNYWNGSTSSSEETKNELNTMFAETISSTLFVAPWEVGICKVCGKDENDHILLLCDRCDSEYHTYCLNPPLERIPKASWYCPPCISFITSQTLAREEDFDSQVLSQSQPPENKKIQREFTRNGLEELADLADTMELVEYWELGVKERVFLLQFLCDETLCSTVIRNHVNADGSDSRRNFMGQDSARRLYWVLGRPERLFVSGPHSEGEVCVTSENSSSKEFDSWTCYESDAEISTLVDWLGDTDAREKDLKESVINWQRNKSNDENGQVEMRCNHFKSSVYCTNARAELEKKFDEGRIVHEGKIRRCDCLEIVGSTRHHCFSCHTTFFGHEEHQCDDSLESENESNPKGIIGKQPSSSSWNTSAALRGRASDIARCLKMILLDIEAALPMDAFRPSRRDPDRLRGWRVFLKSAQSIYEMVQATIILEDMIKTEHLKKEWWYWSSPSAAAKISTISSLSLRIYALDAAIYYVKPPPPPPPPPPSVDLTEPVAVGDSKSKEETPKKSNLENKLKACSLTMKSNDAEPSKTSKFKDKKDKPKKKKLKVSID